MAMVIISLGCLISSLLAYMYVVLFILTPQCLAFLNIINDFNAAQNVIMLFMLCKMYQCLAMPVFQTYVNGNLL